MMSPSYTPGVSESDISTGGLQARHITAAGCGDVTLSVVIPTLNRREYLALTLRQLLSQEADAAVPVEFVVCDNASDQDISGLFRAEGEFVQRARFLRFEERLDIDGSFARAIGRCTGRFVVLFGDDDIPLPGFLREVTAQIRARPDLGIVYVNRIIGDADLREVTEVPHSTAPFGTEIMEAGRFIERFNHWPGFVTCLIFSRDCWSNGERKADHAYPGYNFLSRIYWGGLGKDACYIASPLVIQRRGVQSWKRDWPRYWLVSMPGLLEALDRSGYCGNALALWLRHETTTWRFLVDCVVARAYRYPVTDSFWSESRRFQLSRLRKAISIAVQYLLPGPVAERLYRHSRKMS